MAVWIVGDCTERQIQQLRTSSTDVNIPEVEAAMTTVVSLSYEKWISRWTSHIGRADDVICVPSAATAITTLLVIHNWLSLLANQPYKYLTSFFTTSLSHGFQIGYNPQNSL